MVAIPDREKYEQRIRELLAEQSGPQRAELLKLLGDPPDLSRVPPEFWDRVHRDTEMALAVVLMLAVASQVRAEHWDPLDGDWEPAHAYAQAWALDRANRVAAGYVDTTQQRLQNLAEKWATSPDGQLPSMEERAAAIENVLGPSRHQTVARTEVTAGQSAGSNWVGDQWVAMGRAVRRIWRLGETETHCAICWAVRDTEEEFWRSYPGAESGPPLHPRCACSLQIVLDSRLIARSP